MRGLLPSLSYPSPAVEARSGGPFTGVPGTGTERGYVDHHVHFMASVAAGLSVDVATSTSLVELLDRLREGIDVSGRSGGGAAAGSGAPCAGSKLAWVRAWGYDEALMAERRHPTRWDLDRVCASRGATDVPLVVHHRSGHVAVLNSAALRRLGQGDHPDGVVFDGHEILAGVPRLDVAALTSAAASLSRKWASAGITAFVDATHTNGPEELDLMARWCATGVVVQDVSMMVSVERLGDVPPFATVLGDPNAPGPARLSVGPVKLMPRPGRLDGLRQAIVEAHERGFPAAVHVVDVETLAVTLEAFAKSPPPTGLADRLEHNALSLPEQVPAIAASKARVVVNPGFLATRRTKYERELGDVERGWLIRMRSLLEAGVDLRAGSDSPVSAADPEQIIGCAISHPFTPGESLDPASARRLLSW